MRARDERGFTLVELLVVCSLTLVLLAVGAFAARSYWFVQSLEGAKAELVSEMRSQQQSASAKSYPFVQGLWFLPGSSRWGKVEYDMKTNACTKTSDRTLDSGVVVSTATFTVVPTSTGLCRTAVGNATAQIVFFYPGGTAVAGSLSLTHPRLSSDPRTITVSALTGRVTE